MKKLLLLSFLCVSMVAKAEDIPTNLVVWAKDGSKVAYALADEPKVTFTETNFVISSKGIEVNYAIDKMARFTYETNEQTAIRNIKTGNTSFGPDGEFLLFPSLKANSTLTIYSANGNVVFKKMIREEGEYALPLSNLSKGIYIVDVNGLTYKIMKK